MIKITIITDRLGRSIGIDSKGHAGYDDEGHDIVCAAISVLEINLVNSIEVLTDAKAYVEIDEEKGTFLYKLIDIDNKDAILLIDSCICGLKSIEAKYGNKYIEVTKEEF